MNNLNPAFYRLLYDESPVSIWVEDFTKVYQHICDLKDQGVTDVRAYYHTYPDKFAECIGKLRVVDVNKATLSLYKAESKEQLVNSLSEVFRNETMPSMLESVVAISEGKHSFEGQGINFDLNGNKIVFRMSWKIPGGEPRHLENVIVAIQDLTKLITVRSELEERETLFRCIIEQTSEGMLLVDNSGKAILVNGAMEDLTGLKSQAVVGKNVWDVYDSYISELDLIEEKQTIKDDVFRILNEPFKTNLSFEFRYMDAKHKIHAHKHSIVPISTNKEYMYAIIVTDLTPIYHNEVLTSTMHRISHAVNVTESLDDLFKIIHESLGSLIDVTNFYIAFYDRKSNLITFPYLVDEMNEDPSPVEADNDKSLTAQVISEAKTLLLDESGIKARTDDRNILGVECTNWLGVPLVLAGEVIGALVVQSYNKTDLYSEDDQMLLESISEQIAFALHKKQTDEDKYVLIQAIEQAGEGIIIFSPEGFIKYVNTIFEKTTGYKRVDLFDKPVEYLPFDQNSRIDMQQSWLRVRSSQPWRGKIEMIRKDGAKITLDMVVKPVIESDGRLSSIIASCKDVTYEILREEQLKRTQRLEAIGRLTGGIAHDFNNVLSAIIGYTELAGDDIDSASECSQNLMEVLKSATRAKEMISHLISFSRQEESKTEVIELVDHVRESVRFLRSYLPKSIQIKERYEGENATVIAVPGQMHQIMINLGTNAMHAIQHDHGVLEISVEPIAFRSKDMQAFPELEQCHYLKIMVSDNGTGIDDALIDHIFDPYFTTKSANEGTGLGLSIVHSIVHAHHGAIRVQSVLNEGTTFLVYLPLYNADKWFPSAMVPDENADIAGTENIMFVDDEPMLVNVFRQGLMKLGYKVEGFTDPRRALDYFMKHIDSVDLVVTDTTMPYMNGIDLSTKIMAAKPKIPVILCTGFTTLISAEEAGLKGIRDFIMKPFKIRDMAWRIRKILNQDKEE